MPDSPPDSPPESLTGSAPERADPRADPRRHAPATARNREPLRALLAATLPPAGELLEIASGTGEHAAFFARCFPGLTIQPTDRDPAALASIAAWGAGLANLRPPLRLDVTAPWPVVRADAVLCVNLTHIAPWAATPALMAGAAARLPAGGPLLLYGPFKRGGVHRAESNARFDRDLRRRDPAWGVRDLDAVSAAAEAEGLALARVVEMPANNLTAIYRRSGSG